MSTPAQIPSFTSDEFFPRLTKYCICIPVINEGERIIRELERAKQFGVGECADIIICDGGSVDGSMERAILKYLGVNTLLIKTGSGKQGAQLRMGFWWALNRGYEGIITIDGNDKDSIESVPSFIKKLDDGFDFVQGSRFIKGGKAINTPLARHFAVRFVHAPVISLAARHWFTDTTNAFRAYSKRYLEHPKVQPFRDVFSGYELLAYLSVKASRLGLNVCEVPVTRAYPETGKTPTKIGAHGKIKLLKILWNVLFGKYDVKGESEK